MKIVLPRLLILVFSMLGISASFMPWVIFPKGNGLFYGYHVDGSVTGILFFLILVFSIITYNKQRLPLVLGFLSAIISLWMVYLSYDKIAAIQDQKINFSSDNPLIATATAGFHEGIGLYVLGIAGTGLFIAVLGTIYFERRVKSLVPNPDTFQKRHKLIIYSGGGLLTIALLMVFLFGLRGKTDQVSKEVIRYQLKEGIHQMGETLAKEDYVKFLDYNHPMMIQSYGGKERALALIQTSMDDLRNSGTSIDSVGLYEILEVVRRDADIQAVVVQTVFMTQNGTSKKDDQKMLAVSKID